LLFASSLLTFFFFILKKFKIAVYDTERENRKKQIHSTIAASHLASRAQEKAPVVVFGWWLLLASLPNCRAN
jgi:hypothetical protein